jgi:ppGpp synthetase/RelA/SpoT-type nucleotidyltranferase
MQAQASLEQDIAIASPRKLAQFEIIQKNNPAPNDTLTWIRSPKDIMTWDETIAAKQAGEDVGFSWPDYSFEDALRDQKRGKMTVYSSYPVKGGTFVTPSYQQASDYAGGGRVYSKVIKPEDVAWINGDEGQYAYTKVKSLESTLADADMAVNAAREPEGFTYDYDGSDMAAVQRAYNLATQDQARLDGMLKEISDTLGTEFSSAGQKSMKSMLDKVDRKVRAGRDYTVASMKDHTRGKVMMNSFSEIPQVLKELDSRGIPYETEVVTNPWGYKGYHITFRNPDGISSEIQLTTAAHWPAKLESDAIYDKWRNFDYDSATKAERQRYNEAVAKSQALWAKVDFSEFDKAANSLSDTGRASWSVEPSTLKSGLTQEPSLYAKIPSSSESANTSPSSVTQTFSGRGFDRSPNIDTPFMDIIPQNTSRTLEGELANSDRKINDAGITRIGSADVAPVDTKTLPKSLQAAQEYLNEGNYIKDIENFAGKPYPKLTNQDYLDYAISLKNPKDREFYESIIKDMVDDGTTTYEKYAASAARNNRLNKLRMGSYDDIDPKALASYIANHRQALSNGTIRDVDAELSDRLGIGRSNTLMMDNNLPPDALGAYDPTNSTISIDTNSPEENLVNTLAHERLHSFQTEGDFKRYDKRVTDAYEELSKDLNKYLKTPEETAKRYAFDTDYWGNEREQQSRMLQQYLENKGFTRGGLQKSNAGEWGNEINPAFDKFFDKLRDLSKRGVALPALAGLLGGGVVLDQVLNSKDSDKDKKKTKRSA